MAKLVGSMATGKPVKLQHRPRAHARRLKLNRCGWVYNNIALKVKTRFDKFLSIADYRLHVLWYFFYIMLCGRRTAYVEPVSQQCDFLSGNEPVRPPQFLY